MKDQHTSSQPSNMHQLWWGNTKNDKKFSAGRAFYCEGKGDFALFINLLEESAEYGKRSEIYLRPVQMTCNATYYRLEKVIYKQDKTIRTCIGEGFQGEDHEGDIFIRLEPLTGNGKTLTLSLKPTKESSND
jgi:hypothetical protein